LGVYPENKSTNTTVSLAVERSRTEFTILWNVTTRPGARGGERSKLVRKGRIADVGHHHWAPGTLGGEGVYPSLTGRMAKL
jgi:hypothetical protein